MVFCVLGVPWSWQPTHTLIYTKSDGGALKIYTKSDAGALRSIGGFYGNGCCETGQKELKDTSLR